MFSVKRCFVVGAAGAVVLVGAGAGYAGWISEGTGEGPASASGAVPLVVEIDPNPVSGLYPGATTKVAFAVKNDNDYPVTLVSASAHSFRADPGHADCLIDAGIVRADAAVLHGTLAAGSWSQQHFVEIAMSKDAGDACQGARFSFRLDVDAVSSDA